MKKLLLPITLIILSCSKGDESESKSSSISYETIKYGSLIWSIENANIEAYRDGTPIPQVSDVTEWRNLTTGAWCYYNNDQTKPRLYNWYAVMGIHDTDPNTPNKEFAPEGWHVPSDAEWTTLENFLIANGYNYDGTTTGNKIAKAMASTTGWAISSTAGTPGNDQSLNNSSGFNAFPGGFRNSYGEFDYGQFDKAGILVSFWSSTAGPALPSTWLRRLRCFDSYLKSINFDNLSGFSVRFVRD